jgi:glycosyltransferase involved in cell wall biosynthesis
MLPKHNIAAVYVGHAREAGSSIDARAAADLKARYNGPGQFFLETYLPRDMLAALLRALDIYFYWPGDCTQSGIIAHALGAGATIACRDMEGVGETVKMAGGLTSANFEELILKMRQTIVDPGLRVEIAESALAYAEEFSWKNQLLRHLELAEDLCPSGARRLTDVVWADAGPAEISTLLRVGSTV